MSLVLTFLYLCRAMSLCIRFICYLYEVTEPGDPQHMVAIVCSYSCVTRHGSISHSVVHLSAIYHLATSLTAPQDAHQRLQVAEWLTASLYQCSREVSDLR